MPNDVKAMPSSFSGKIIFSLDENMWGAKLLAKHKLAIYSSIMAGSQFGTWMYELLSNMGIMTRKQTKTVKKRSLKRSREDGAPKSVAIHYKPLYSTSFLSYVWILWWGVFFFINVLKIGLNLWSQKIVQRVIFIGKMRAEEIKILTIGLLKKG